MAGRRTTGKWGCHCNIEVISFGEKVWFRKLQESGSNQKSLDSKRDEGIWLGHTRGSSEVLIGIYRWVVKAWAAKGM